MKTWSNLMQHVITLNDCDHELGNATAYVYNIWLRDRLLGISVFMLADDSDVQLKILSELSAAHENPSKTEFYDELTDMLAHMSLEFAESTELIAELSKAATEEQAESMGVKKAFDVLDDHGPLVGPKGATPDEILGRPKDSDWPNPPRHGMAEEHVSNLIRSGVVEDDYN